MGRLEPSGGSATADMNEAPTILSGMSRWGFRTVGSCRSPFHWRHESRRRQVSTALTRCSSLQVPRNRSDLIAEPRMSGVGCKPSVPGHFIIEACNLTWRLDYPDARCLSKFARQPAGRRENHVALCYSETGGQEVGQHQAC